MTPKSKDLGLLQSKNLCRPNYPAQNPLKSETIALKMTR